jgi:hypothetical protein
MQFKTYFSVKPLTESKLNTLNINYSTFWVDKIKINYFNETAYLNQYINIDKFPRLEKTYITEKIILNKKLFLQNLIPFHINEQVKYEKYLYELFKIKYNYLWKLK